MLALAYVNHRHYLTQALFDFCGCKPLADFECGSLERQVVRRAEVCLVHLREVFLVLHRWILGLFVTTQRELVRCLNCLDGTGSCYLSNGTCDALRKMAKLDDGVDLRLVLVERRALLVDSNMRP